MDTKHKKWPCSECVALVVITTLQIIQQRAAELHTEQSPDSPPVSLRFWGFLHSPGGLIPCGLWTSWDWRSFMYHRDHTRTLRPNGLNNDI